jgi:hypothetical protein
LNQSDRTAEKLRNLTQNSPKYQPPNLKNAIISLLDSKVAFLGLTIANPGRKIDKAIDLIRQSEVIILWKL